MIERNRVEKTTHIPVLVSIRKSFVVFLVFLQSICLAQNLTPGIPVLEEAARRSQVLGETPSFHSFQVRPFKVFPTDSSGVFKSIEEFYPSFSKEKGKLSKIRIGSLPLVSSTSWNTHMPYGWGNKGMVPNVGLQTYLTAGIFAKLYFLEITLQPEYVYAQNKPFQGFSNNFSTQVIESRFFYWNNGDNPERFGNRAISRLSWGQSSAMLVFGPVSAGISTENIWWGPGQFNSLIFSDNAEGFPHLTLRTNRPIKTWIGNLEAEILSGRLENSMLPPTQDMGMNSMYFDPLPEDWRYLNGLTISYNPSFLKHLYLGFSRTFQQYSSMMGNNFRAYFPVFEMFQKKSFFENGNTVAYDGRGQDQQVAISLRYLVPKANIEVYAQYGRRDHAYNWRDFFVNPEHARSYLIGFQKLFPLETQNSFVQMRGEITHQQESVNRYLRYPGLRGNQTWHTHGLARGFVNYGQALGVGSGVGANVQTLEIAYIKNLMKRGIVLERLENNQDFFYRAFGQNPEKNPWIDLSLGFLWDQQFDRLVLSGKAQMIKSYNYQWESVGISTNNYPNGKDAFSFFANFHLIYQLKK